MGCAWQLTIWQPMGWGDGGIEEGGGVVSQYNISKTGFTLTVGIRQWGGVGGLQGGGGGGEGQAGTPTSHRSSHLHNDHLSACCTTLLHNFVAQNCHLDCIHMWQKTATSSRLRINSITLNEISRISTIYIYNTSESFLLVLYYIFWCTIL